MRTTVTLDDALYEQALAVADPDMDKADLFREAVKTFVRIQSAKRLAALEAACQRCSFRRGAPVPRIPHPSRPSLPLLETKMVFRHCHDDTRHPRGQQRLG